MTDPNKSQSLQSQNTELRQALENICRHQEKIAGNGALIGNVEMYRMTGAWQIANKALEEQDKLNDSP